MVDRRAAHYFARPDAAPGTVGEPLLLKVAIAVGVAYLVIQRVADTMFVRRIRATKGQPAAERLAALRGAMIFRLAMLEGPALFGIALCYLATSQGPPENRAMWIGLIPAGLFVFYGVVSFPNRERLTALLTEL